MNKLPAVPVEEIRAALTALRSLKAHWAAGQFQVTQPDLDRLSREIVELEELLRDLESRDA
jgi:hypothetical protein